jgi:hypothetical protein
MRSCQPGAVGLEDVEHIAVDPQRDGLLHAGDRGLVRREIRLLRGRRLEGFLGGGARIGAEAVVR